MALDQTHTTVKLHAASLIPKIKMNRKSENYKSKTWVRENMFEKKKKKKGAEFGQSG